MLTVDDILSLRGVGGARISPDGRQAAFVVTAANAGTWAEPAGSRIWLVGTASDEPRQLTAGPGKDSAPAWSPDGQALAFLSDRGGDGTRLYLLPLDGGEARPLDTGTGKVKEFAWSPDGRRIAFVRNDRDDLPQDEANAPIVVEGTPHHDRIWTIEVATGAVGRGTEAAAHVWELAWFPDSRSLALVAADEPTSAAWYSCRLARLDLDSGALTTLYQPPAGKQIARPAPSPDGRRVAFVSCSWSDPGMTGGDLLVVPATGGAPQNLTPGAPFSITHAAWRPDGDTLVYDAYDGNAVSVGTVSADGSEGPQRLWHGPCSFARDRISVASDGQTFVAARDSAREPTEVWCGRIGDGRVSWRRLTDFAAAARAKLMVSSEDVQWRAADGLEIAGVLLRPAGASGPLPVVAIIHGGPTGMASHSFQSRGLAALAPLLADRGIAAFAPNYRGSNGRGVAFAELNHGDMGGGDWADIVAGLDHLVATGVADPARLAIIGWSYGGFMTMWAVTQDDRAGTPRFKAAVAGAGLSNWLSFHGTSILHTWDRIFHSDARGDADPYAPDGIYAMRSPIFQAHRIATPTLILQGDADQDVPPSQSWEFYRALKDRGVETEFVLYPGAAHGPSDPRHIRDILERSLDWLTTRL